MSKPVRVDAVVGQILEKHGIVHQVRRMEVLDAWPDLVGEGVARVTRAKGVDGATLLVEVRTSSWLMELNMMKGVFLEKVNQHLTDAPIDRIVFVLAETP